MYTIPNDSKLGSKEAQPIVRGGFKKTKQTYLGFWPKLAPLLKCDLQAFVKLPSHPGPNLGVDFVFPW